MVCILVNDGTELSFRGESPDAPVRRVVGAVVHRLDRCVIERVAGADQQHRAVFAGSMSFQCSRGSAVSASAASM